MKRDAILTLLILLCTIMAGAKTKTAANFCKLKVASWNIGHFALGKGDDTSITSADYEEKQQAYRAFLNDVDADILALCEYNPLFVKATAGQPAITARDAILGQYVDAAIGEKHSYNCNAVFSNGLKTGKTTTQEFKDKVQPRYYLCREFLINGIKVKFVVTHLDWNEREIGKDCRAKQIEELIETFKDDHHVILCADWNTQAESEYAPFIRAGYTMANNGYMGKVKTWPAGPKASGPIDNIICKGFAVTGVHARHRPDLSDHALIEASLTLLP